MEVQFLSCLQACCWGRSLSVSSRWESSQVAKPLHCHTVIFWSVDSSIQYHQISSESSSQSESAR